ncbi:putative Cysteine/Histidine-rich C1 domain family protein [Hibiscus syriacus]|uniref:Cysteine/Histidine-rich C1 domain family protein n=1 Tax=Hibiscus syriacus TaxID=106335 RepID=A0A6A3BX56_HIBSY|nr:putative Cysteine/Histidine-rich C1 domain family protein [Hibiscus syriacus]
MESQNFGHQHPMVFNEERGNETKEPHCGRCGETVSGPCFSCPECGFSLHNKCAEAPSEIAHPFHRQHPLLLLPKPPYDFHVKCALITLSIAEKKPEEIKQIATIEPPVVPGEGDKSLENSACFGCWEPLGESTYFSIDFGFNLHKKCAQLPHEINHPFHKQHPLVLQFNGERSSFENRVAMVYVSLRFSQFAMRIIPSPSLTLSHPSPTKSVPISGEIRLSHLSEPPSQSEMENQPNQPTRLYNVMMKRYGLIFHRRYVFWAGGVLLNHRSYASDTDVGRTLDTLPPIMAIPGGQHSSTEADTPEAELATDWWQASKRFFDRTVDEQPPLREPSPRPELSPHQSHHLIDPAIHLHNENHHLFCHIIEPLFHHHRKIGDRQRCHDVYLPVLHLHLNGMELGVT